MKKDQKEQAVIVMDTGETIHVTPSNPLIVTTTPVRYDSVSIEGGDVTVGIQAEVTFGNLTKVS